MRGSADYAPTILQRPSLAPPFVFFSPSSLRPLRAQSDGIDDVVFAREGVRWEQTRGYGPLGRFGGLLLISKWNDGLHSPGRTEEERKADDIRGGGGHAHCHFIELQ